MLTLMVLKTAFRFDKTRASVHGFLLSLVVMCFMASNPRESVHLWSHYRKTTAPIIKELDNQMASRVQKQTDRGALLIVEPRHHPRLKQVIDAFSAVVPPHWTLYVVHKSANAEFALAAASTTSEIRPTKFVNLDTLPHIDLTGGFNDYNVLFKTSQFWESTIPEEEEHILVFQTDSMPCSSSVLDLDRFGVFGYIGCMCDIDKVGPDSVPFFGHYGFYGIGGLSLRRRKFMLDCLKVHPDTGCPDAEDKTFSSCNDALSYKYGSPPDMYDVGDFCGQCGWGNVTRAPKSWASHKVIMQGELLDRFIGYCPQAVTTTMAAQDRAAAASFLRS